MVPGGREPLGEELVPPLRRLREQEAEVVAADIAAGPIRAWAAALAS